MDDKVTQREALKHFCSVSGCQELATHRVVIKVDPAPGGFKATDDGSVPQLELTPDLRVCGGRACQRFIRKSLNPKWVQGAVEEAVGHRVKPITNECLHHEFAPLALQGLPQA